MEAMGGSYFSSVADSAQRGLKALDGRFPGAVFLTK
jgi:hypothetical protein